MPDRLFEHRPEGDLRAARVQAGAGPGGGVTLLEDLAGREAGLLEERERSFGAAPEVVELPLPGLGVVAWEHGRVFAEDHAEAEGVHEFAVGEMDDDVADRPVLARKAMVEASGAKPADGFVQERRLGREPGEGFLQVRGDA